MFHVREDFVKSLRDAVGRQSVGQLLTIFGKWEQPDAAIVRRANQSTVAAEAELFDESLSLVRFGTVVEQSPSVLLDIWSSYVSLTHLYNSCIDPLWSLGERSSTSLVVGNISSPEIENFFSVDERRAQHGRWLVGNDLNFIIIVAILSLTVIVIAIRGRVDLNIRWIWICQTIRLITCAACFIAYARITVITRIAAERNDFWVRLAAVPRLISEQIFLQSLWNRRLVVVGVELLNIVHNCPLGTFIVAVVSWQCAPSVRVNLKSKALRKLHAASI